MINLARLSRELDETIKKFSTTSEVILIAHSGGASIALDYLKQKGKDNFSFMDL